MAWRALLRAVAGERPTGRPEGGRAPKLVGRQRVLHVRFAPKALVQPPAAGWEEIGLAALAGQRVLAVSAVARPRRIYRALRDWEAELVHVLEYPDHHRYDAPIASAIWVRFMRCPSLWSGAGRGAIGTASAPLHTA